MFTEIFLKFMFKKQLLNVLRKIFTIVHTQLSVWPGDHLRRTGQPVGEDRDLLRTDEEPRHLLNQGELARTIPHPAIFVP